MSCYRKLILVLLLCLEEKTEVSLAFQRFVYQKDMSEYCRRRVIPSAFLGRQVVDANSKILHFSRIELPYSCFINVRTESGSNIILVIQLTSEKSLIQSCKENANQLIVYEIGETFGGYWGPLPDNLMKAEPTEKVNFYTMKTTQPPTTTTEISIDEETVVEGLVSEQEDTQRTESKDKDYITIELPIVNVSAHLVPGEIQPESIFSIDDSFDVLYDVTPGVGVQYETSVMPLVQFSIDNIIGGKRRGGGVEWSSRHEADYSEDFTLDPRLAMPLFESTTPKRKKLHYNKYNVNRRLNFRKSKYLFTAKETPIYRKQHTVEYITSPYNSLSNRYKYVEPPRIEKKVESIPNSWEIIEDILRNLSKTKDISTETPFVHRSELLYSVPGTSEYLAPNLSAYKNFSISNSQSDATRYTHGPITWRLPPESHQTDILEQLAVTKQDNVLIQNTSESGAAIEHYTRKLDRTEGVGPQEFPLYVDNTRKLERTEGVGPQEFPLDVDNTRKLERTEGVGLQEFPLDVDNTRKQERTEGVGPQEFPLDVDNTRKLERTEGVGLQEFPSDVDNTRKLERTEGVGPQEFPLDVDNTRKLERTEGVGLQEFPLDVDNTRKLERTEGVGPQEFPLDVDNTRKLERTEGVGLQEFPSDVDNTRKLERTEGVGPQEFPLDVDNTRKLERTEGVGLQEFPLDVDNTRKLERTEGVGPQEFPLDVDSIILKAANVTNIAVDYNQFTNLTTDATETNSPNSVQLLTGSLVDHESWENVVQAAPVMAVLLNQTVSHNSGAQITKQLQEKTTVKSSKSRKKRYINVISIENARPHKIPTVKEIFASTTPSLNISNVQDFAELVELQDDEMRGRVALRYIRQYVGPVLFNICDYSEATERHVYLFNTSRLVLAINNFTMDRMTVVVTAARTLRSSEARCTDKQLECQIAGARVCIDSLSACDGIPNCGSSDIYDEDRLMCGAAAGLLHNVCLAAFTFLAVLLTILYTIHYWLNRCVPKVSDAFFIYKDAAENVLYLDSVMRPPQEGDEEKENCRSHIFQEEVQSPHVNCPRKNIFHRFVKSIFNFLICKCKKNVTSDNVIEEFNQPQRRYSFAENEIEKMIQKNWAEAAVQTGSSLEMNVRREKTSYEFPLDFRHVNEKPGTSKDTSKSKAKIASPESLSFEKLYDELSLLKFFRQARSDSLGTKNSSLVNKVSSASKNMSQIHEEEELQYFELEHLDHSILSPLAEQGITTGEVHIDKIESAHALKRLRFDEETTTIPSVIGNEAVEENDNPRQRSTTVLTAGRVPCSQDLDSIEECEEQSGSREHKSYFWGSNKSKSKKIKKKSQVRLR